MKMPTPTPQSTPSSTPSSEPTPSIEMPGKYAPAEHEARISDRWNQANAFNADPSRVLSGEAQPYSIVSPPPNVTGALHLGHALNNSIQDILARAHRMKGYETLWMPGTDHAGIATQAVVDKRLIQEGKPSLVDYKRIEADGKDGRSQFIDQVMTWKDEYEQRITNQLKAMGCSCDWERQRFTMDDMCAQAVREAFFQLFKAGLIYRGKRLVNWDPVSQTALADDEVEMQEVEGIFAYLRYPLVHQTEPGDHSPVTWSELAARGWPTELVPAGVSDDGRAFITVATTRPETYLGDAAVALNPKDPRAVALRGLFAELPLVGRVIPIVEDDYVVLPVALGGDENDAKAKMATGFLKVTPAHDPNDYEIGVRHSLEPINVMAPDASISDKHGWTDIGDAQIFVGLSREAARKKVLEEFKARGLLEAVKPHAHSVGHSYRSHAAVEPYLSDQWYVKVTDDRLRGNAQRALKPEQRSEASLKQWPESAPQSTTKSGSQNSGHLNSGHLNSGHLNSGTGFQPVGNDFTSHRRHLPHWQKGGSTYFITFRTSGKVLSDEAKQCVLDACTHFHNERATIRLVTVMPDYVHMLLTPLEKSLGQWWSLQELMHSIKSFTANRVNEIMASTGAVWQDEYFDRIIRDEDEYLEKWNYILSNSVKAGLASSPGEYRFTASPLDGLEARPTIQHDGLEARPTIQHDRLEARPTHNSDGLEARTTEQHDGLEARPTGHPTSDASMTFHPSRYAKSYEQWHDNLRDWCISRQLWWGHRIPAWHPTEGTISKLVESTGSLHPNTREIKLLVNAAIMNGRIASQAKASKIEDQVNPSLQTRLTYSLAPGNLNHALCVLDPEGEDAELVIKLEASGYKRDPDVLDTWFSSALWPLSTMGWPEKTDLLDAFNPTSVLCTAREIITLWVSRMVMFNRYFLSSSGTGFQPVSSSSLPNQDDGLEARPTDMNPGHPPFKDVFIHAMIQDGEGRKMSKSLGNGVDPLDIIHSHGTDALRYTLAHMTTQTQDVRLPVQRDEITGKNTSPRFDLGRNFCNKLWNASRFVITMLSEHASGKGSFDRDQLTLPDRWMLSRLEAGIKACDEALANYQFSTYAQALYDLLWRDYCDWYVEAVKPTLKSSPTQQAVLRAVLDAILRLLHPVTPFVTEAIFEKLSQITTADVPGLTLTAPRKAGLLCLAGWPQSDGSLSDATSEELWSKVQDLVSVIREVRSQQQIKPRQRITLHVPDAARATILPVIESAREVVEFMAGVGTVSQDPPTTRSVDIRCLGLDLTLSDLSEGVDSDAERLRLTRELADKDKSILAMETRLANPGYSEKAPAHLVQQTRDQLAQVKKERDALAESLERLA